MTAQTASSNTVSAVPLEPKFEKKKCSYNCYSEEFMGMVVPAFQSPKILIKNLSKRRCISMQQRIMAKV